MKKNYFLILACATLFSITSCVKDTCNGELGNTFETIEFDSIYGTPDIVGLNFSMTTLNDLPEGYFIDVISGDEETDEQLGLIIASKTELSIILENSILPEIDESKDFSFSLHFMDRRNYIDCQHSGSADAYFLELAFRLMRMEEDEYTISDFVWNEIFVTGHL